MSKFIRLAILALLVGVLALPQGASAQEHGMKGFGLSGYVDAVGAFSRTSGDYAGGTIAPGLYAGTATLNTGGTASPNDESDFTFAATELKLHFNQDFSDKAVAMASLSFAAMSGGGFGFDLQQAAVGVLFDDTHVLLGRFYAPIGIESVDANSRATATLGNVFAGLEPFFLTGLMIHYAPDEGVGGFVFLSNNIQDANDENNGVQSKDNAKAIGVGVTFGQDDISGTLQYNVDWTNGSGTDAFEDASQLVDLSVLMDSDELMAGLDAIWRHENVGAGELDAFGIELLLAAKMDDLTAGLRAEVVVIDDEDSVIGSTAVGGTFGGDGTVYGLTPFVTYAVTDGVFARFEYRADITDYTGADMANTQTFIAQLNATFE